MKTSKFLLALAALPMTVYADFAVHLTEDKFDLDVTCEAHENLHTESVEESLLSAKDQLSSIWNKILQTKYAEIPPYHDTGFFKKLKLLCPSFAEKAITHTGDEMIPGREKHIHSSGSVIKVSFVPEKDHPFTGIFASGSEHALMRVSLAKAAEKNMIIPGIALKFFIDGKDSQNIMAMYSLGGQTSRGFFDNNMSNRVPVPQNIDFAQRQLDKSFRKAMKNLDIKGEPNELPVKHLASITSDGSLVEHVVAPHKLHFVVSYEAKRLTENTQISEDFRTILDGKGEKMPLFFVFAEFDQNVPNADKTMYRVGTIIGESSFVASQYGDEVLYFQHHFN